MSMLSTTAPWDLVAQGYSETAMKMFEAYAEAALDLTGVGADDLVLDVACGPGTLTLLAAERARRVSALDFSENMLAVLREKIADRGGSNISVVQGDGQDLPYAAESFTAAFSMFGLMFFPDRPRGYAELHRTLRPGGRVCVSSWAPVADSPFLQVMFEAMRAMNPDIPAPKTNSGSLENSDVLKAEIVASGFHDVQVHRVTRGGEFASALDFWDAISRGSAPLLQIKKTMPEEVWQQKSVGAIARIEELLGSFPATLTADAWIGVGMR